MCWKWFDVLVKCLSVKLMCFDLSVMLSWYLLMCSVLIMVFGVCWLNVVSSVGRNVFVVKLFMCRWNMCCVLLGVKCEFLLSMFCRIVSVLLIEIVSCCVCGVGLMLVLVCMNSVLWNISCSWLSV